MIAAVAVLAGIAGMAANLLFRDAPPTPLQDPVATVLEPPRALPELELIDHRGEAVDRARFEGGWDLLFFGFTHCPDVCPTTLYDLAQASAIIEEHGGTAPDVYMVTVDPARDDAETLAAYVPFFDRDFTGITGSLPELEVLFRNLGVAYGYRDRDDGSYDVDHTPALFLIDPEGRFRALYNPPYRVADLATSLRRVMEFPG